MTKELKTTLDYARYYVSKGFSVIPLKPKDKKPIIPSWKEYQSRKPTDEELIKWFNGNQNNIAIVTGEISGIAVVDSDSKKAYEFCRERGFFQKAPTVKTGRIIKLADGYHFYFRYAPGIFTKINVNHIHLDIKGDGSYVVAPPSIHPSGEIYKWTQYGLDDLPLADLPEIILAKSPEQKPPLKDLYQGAPDGQRNDTLARLTGSWVNDKLTFEECLQNAHIWNSKNASPLPERELENTVKSIFETHYRNKPDPQLQDSNTADEKPTQAVKLIRIASKYKTFHDDVKDCYVQVEHDLMKVRSAAFKQFLSRELYQGEGKAPNSDSLNQALNVIEAQARYDGECIKLYNRVAEHDGNFYFDLSNGKAVKVTKFGWSIVDPPILFKRYVHQQKQIEPKRGGDINRLFDFLNVTDDRHRLLILVYLISCFVPDIPHPIFHPWGDQGSGKTTMFIFFKLLIDPSKLNVIITPRDHNELVQILEHHYLCLFDNLSSFPGWLSDLLSQACTGGGFSKRRLYTDDDDVIFQIMRCIGLNGINLLIGKPDLMDRTILLHLERIDPTARKEWKTLMEEFEEERPYLLGCLFAALAKARAIYPTVKLSQLPRMADFVRWGVAIAQALGYAGQDFITAYQGNVESQNAEIINGNTLAQAVLSFMDDKESWSGTVKQAYEGLSQLVTLSKEDRTFPKHYNKLRQGLNRIKPNLLDFGIRFSIADFNTEKGVYMSFQKIGKVSSVSSGYQKSNNINVLQTEDPEHPEHTQKVSSGHNPLINKDSEDPEHPEDKIPTFLEEDEKIEIIEVFGVTT